MGANVQNETCEYWRLVGVFMVIGRQKCSEGLTPDEVLNAILYCCPELYNTPNREKVVRDVLKKYSNVKIMDANERLTFFGNFQASQMRMFRDTTFQAIC